MSLFQRMVSQLGKYKTVVRISFGLAHYKINLIAMTPVCIWRYPSMHQVATLTGHTYRVLYLAMSPDVSLIFFALHWKLIPFAHHRAKQCSFL